MTDFHALRTRWIDEQPTYQELANAVKETLTHAFQGQGIRCTVVCRTKDVASFVTKAIRKKYESPYEQVTDKAGARVVVTYREQVPTARSIIEQMFDILETVDKSDALGEDRLGYQGVHYLVKLKVDQLTDGREHLAGLACEIQVNTQAQRLWADVEHELAYKGVQMVSPQAKRTINRLVALIEIFDDEVMRAKAMIENQQGFREAAILSDLEGAFFRLTGRNYDKELSLDVIRTVLPAIPYEETIPFGPVISNFVSEHDSKIRHLFEIYANDERCSPLLFQPESLLVFQLICTNPFVLKECWCESLPLPLLEDLAAVWGTAI